MSSDPCKLCGNAELLLNSHVIPELLYRPTYTSRGGALSFNSKLDHVRVLRKGVRERLLCQQCELLLKEHEDYFAEHWLQASRVPDPLPTDATEIRVSGLDYRRFKLFHLSITWRTGVAKGEDYVPITLGTHEHPLRQMLLAGDPGAQDDYPIFACVLRMRTASRPASQIVALAHPELRDGVTITSTIYAGCSWCCALGRGAKTEFANLYLSDRGQMTLPIESVGSRQSLVRLVSGREASFKKAVAKLNDRSPRG